MRPVGVKYGTSAVGKVRHPSRNLPLSLFLGTGLVILGVATFYQLIVVGIILIIAVYIDQRRRNTLR